MNANDQSTKSTDRRRRAALILILLADMGLLAWCAAAALHPEQLIGPGGVPILQAGYEGYTGGSWQELLATSPGTTAFMTLLFRLFGAYGAAFSLTAIVVAATAFRGGERWSWWVLLAGNTIGYVVPMTYDAVVHAIGPFELLEYVGLAAVYVALGLTAPFGAGARALQRARARA